MSDQKILTISTRMNVCITVDAELGADGAFVTCVRSIDLPCASEVMEALDGECQLDEFDALFNKAT